MAKGDHIYVCSTGYTHHGIDCGDGTVIEYAGKLGGEMIIRRVAKSSFGYGKTIYVKEYGNCFSPAETISLAERELGKGGYNLFNNNCEHFAHYCKTGKRISEQSRRVVAGVESVGYCATASSAAKVVAKAVTQSAINSASPITKGLIAVGLKKAPTIGVRAAAGIVGVGGLASGLAADAVVGRLLEDRENLPADERRARKVGRIASQAASTVSAVAGGATAVVVGGTAVVAAAVAAPAVLGIGIGLGAYHLHRKK